MTNDSAYDYDLCIIGAGPGGYVCAIRAAQLGKKVAIIEKRAADNKRGPSLGGTCLNLGCIPSKTLLDSSEHFHNAEHNFAAHGIELGKVKIDVSKMMKRKDKVVRELTNGIAYLMKKNKITVIPGCGSLSDAHSITVSNGPDSKTISADNIVLATGSVPVELPFLPFDDSHIVSSNDAIAFDKVPKKLIVVGGGVIGLELGSVWHRLGAEVTIIEFLPNIAAGFDSDIATALRKVLKKQGMKFELECKVTGAKVNKASVTLSAENKAGETLSFNADKVLVSVGRKPFTEGIGLENVGVDISERGQIVVNQSFQTSVANIYAIGDLIHGPMLAHKAEEDGVAVAEILSGEKAHVDYNLIPGVVYTWPELAMVGITEDQAKKDNIPVNVGTSPFMANGRAKAAGDVDGFVKIIAHAETDEVLGVGIIGPRASDLIAESVAMMEYSASAEDIARVCHAHPTFSEVTKEAALATLKRPLHG